MIKFFSPDARIFGLPVWRKRPTDAEYIERVRKRLHRARWIRILLGIIGIGTVVLCLWMLQLCVAFILDQGVPQAQQVNVFLAMFIAVFFGFNIGWLIHSCFDASISLIIESRRDRMLVECWDLLHQLIADRDARLNQASDTMAME